MKTRDTQGSFILLIWTLILRVKELTRAPIVLLYPRANVVADLFLRPVICRSMQRRQAEEAQLSLRVYRFSSVDCSSCPGTSGGVLNLTRGE